MFSPEEIIFQWPPWRTKLNISSQILLISSWYAFKERDDKIFLSYASLEVITSLCDH